MSRAEDNLLTSHCTSLRLFAGIEKRVQGASLSNTVACRRYIFVALIVDHFVDSLDTGGQGCTVCKLGQWIIHWIILYLAVDNPLSTG